MKQKRCIVAASRILLGMVVAVSLSTLRAAAQSPLDRATAGRNFLIAFPDTTWNTYDPRQDTDPRFAQRNPKQDTIAIAIYAAAADTVTITAPGYADTVTLSAGQFRIVYLNGAPRAPQQIVDRSGMISHAVFHVESSSPIVLYCYIMTKFGAEAFTPLPVGRWGKNYHAAALPGETVTNEAPQSEMSLQSSPKAAPAEILIIAARNNTHVTISPSGALDGSPMTTVTLNAGEAYQVQSYVDTSSGTQADIAGSFISADKPIGVVSGNSRSMGMIQSGGVLRNAARNLAIEWLAPTDQHGTEFVYLPTWDQWRPTFLSGENPASKRPGEIVRVYGTFADQGTDSLRGRITWNNDDTTSARSDSFSVGAGRFQEQFLPFPRPHRIVTDRPAQTYMNSAATIIFIGNTGAAGFVGSSWSDIASYMVELVPREQWGSVAPYVTLPDPSSMSSFINLVTDSASRNKILLDGTPWSIGWKIDGTDLYWSSRAVARGTEGVITGTDSTVRFSGFVYGTMPGFETYRPGKTKWEGDGGATSGIVLHPSEYEESIGLAYGYPLAPRRKRLLRQHDSLVFETAMIGSEFNVGVTAFDPSITTLSSITLEEGNNARLLLIEPAIAAEVEGSTEATVKVVPIDSNRMASGTVVVVDGDDNAYRLPYAFSGVYVSFDAAPLLDFGIIPPLFTADRRVTLTNGSTASLRIDRARLRSGSSFTITESDPKIPATIPAAGTISIQVRALPANPGQIYMDTLVLDIGAAQTSLPIRAETESTLSVSAEKNAGGYALAGNRPNPFSQSTTISFTLGKSGRVSLRVFDELGRPIATLVEASMSAGDHSVDWRTIGLPAGRYYYRITSGGWSGTGAMQVTR